MRTRSVVATLAACLTLSACQGLKDALSAHVDVVAHTVSQDLTVTRLGSLLGNAKVPLQITPENAVILAGLWSSYHRLAYAGAHSDTMTDKLDAAISPILNNQRVSMLFDSLKGKVHVDSATESLYNSAGGGLLDARMILFAYPEPATPQQKDSVRKAAEAVRPNVTAANFQAMAKKYSRDAQSAAQGGDLGVFPIAQMIPESPAFSRTIATLKPGEISGLVETRYGIHILQRLTWADAKAQYVPAYTNSVMMSADSALAANLGKSADLQVKKDSATIAQLKASVRAEGQHHDDHTVIATFNRGGKFTIADFLTWVDVMQADARNRVIQALPGAADSDVTMFAKNMALHAVMLRSADSMKIQVPATEQTALREQFHQMVVETWKQLNVAPEQLADSAKTVSDREQLASKRIDSFIDKFMAGEATPTNVIVPLEAVLDAKYKSTLNTAGITRAVQEAEKTRAAADSLSAAREPASSVPLPLPGGPPGAPSKAPAPPGKKAGGGQL